MHFSMFWGICVIFSGQPEVSSVSKIKTITAGMQSGGEIRYFE